MSIDGRLLFIKQLAEQMRLRHPEQDDDSIAQDIQRTLKVPLGDVRSALGLDQIPEAPAPRNNGHARSNGHTKRPSPPEQQEEIFWPDGPPAEPPTQMPDYMCVWRPYSWCYTLKDRFVPLNLHYDQRDVASFMVQRLSQGQSMEEAHREARNDVQEQFVRRMRQLKLCSDRCKVRGFHYHE